MSGSKYKNKSIPIGAAGSIKISLPRLVIGSGKPKVLLLAGLHGDERTGLIVISRLLEKLRLEKGSLHIIPAANPLAQALNQREEPFGRKDPNRVFPEVKNEDFTQRLTYELFNYAKGSDCVIDLHTLGTASRLMAIFMNHGTRAMRKTSLELIKIFSPDLVWQLSTKSTLGSSWRGSMGPEMAGEGIVNFAVEMENLDHVKDDEINRAVNGILRVLNKLGMIKTAPKPSSQPPQMFTYRPTMAKETGLFEPRTELLARVLAGDFPTVAEDDLIGELIDPIKFSKIKVRSRFAGPLIAISRRAFVRTGDDLYNVGEVKPWTMLADATVEMIQKYVQAMRPPKITKRLRQKVKDVKKLASEQHADSSICEAAIWLSALDEDRNINNHLADSFMRAVQDIDDETRDCILDCLNNQKADTKETKVVRMTLK